MKIFTIKFNLKFEYEFTPRKKNQLIIEIFVPFYCIDKSNTLPKIFYYLVTDIKYYINFTSFPNSHSSLPPLPTDLLHFPSLLKKFQVQSCFHRSPSASSSTSCFRFLLPPLHMVSPLSTVNLHILTSTHSLTRTIFFGFFRQRFLPHRLRQRHSNH